MFWIGSTLLAFAVTATVFLVLAELGASDRQESFNAGVNPGPDADGSLSIELTQDELQGLEEAEGQMLEMTLSNASDRRLTGINVYLTLYSEDTAEQEIRYYETPKRSLAPSESKPVEFDLDLSPPGSGSSSGSPGATSDGEDPESFSILEVRAASSEGVSTVKTAVLSF